MKKSSRVKKSKTRSADLLSPIDLKALLEAGCHFGHRVSKTHPKAQSFLYGKKGGVQIFDLIKTAKCLEEARNFIFKLVSSKEVVLLVGTKRQAKKAIKQIAVQTQMPYVHSRWLGGTLTNWEEISRRVKRLEKLTRQMKEGDFKGRTKREQSLLRKEIADLKEKFGGLTRLKGLPGALFIIDIVREKIALQEAIQAKVPVVAIADSNADPTLAAYPIPANDDARRSIELITNIIGEAIKKGEEGSGKK
ncbi:MAG: 30S ribosomal protein S2 [Candidatus Shapirobacteria bacterium]